MYLEWAEWRDLQQAVQRELADYFRVGPSLRPLLFFIPPCPCFICKRPDEGFVVVFGTVERLCKECTCCYDCWLAGRGLWTTGVLTDLAFIHDEDGASGGGAVGERVGALAEGN
jgi:hypothetical protein